MIPGGSRATIVESCITSSYLWPNFEVLQLNTNMRVSAGNDVELQQFDRWQMEIGDGENVIGDKIMLPAANVFNIKFEVYISNVETQRERGDNGLFITLVPKVLQ